MKVAVVTGTRAEYGIWRPVLRAVAAARGLDLQLVVTGMHLLRKFGQTVGEIRRDGWAVAAEVEMYREGEPPAESLGRGTAGLGRAFARLGSEMVLVLGDRLEMLAAAQAAMCGGRILGHLHGGETAPGQFDEQIRHAITKMSHVHFAATREAGRRILQMGEMRERVFVCGAPAIDEARVAWERFEREGGGCGGRGGGDGGAVVVVHPTCADEEMERRRARLVLRAVRKRCGEDVLVVGPNNDPGHGGILRAYEEAGVGRGWGRMAMSLGQEAFWRELWRRGVLVGNSSSGIIEAATLRCAAVNIGERQAGRERSGNVIDVGFKRGEIEAALERVAEDKAFGRRVARGGNVYGDGRAAERIVAVLRGVRPRGFVRTKRFVER